MAMRQKCVRHATSEQYYTALIARGAGLETGNNRRRAAASVCKSNELEQLPAAAAGMLRRSSPRLGWRLLPLRWAVLVLLFAASGDVRAEVIILHLKNGDRIAGTIISEDTNRIVVTTSWIKELAVPVAEIARREPGTEALQGSSVAPLAGERAVPIMSARVAAAPPSPKPKYWKGEARVGADFLYGPQNQQIYYGRLNLAYARPYNSNPLQFFRNVLDYSVDYGWTQDRSSNGNNNSVVSANRMYGSDKSGFDVGSGKWYVYNLAAAGYDRIRKINFQDELGPGLGYHLFTRTNFLMNVESGVDYQQQYRSDNTSTKNFYLRFGQDITWKINRGLTFSEKVEFLPQVNLENYRARAESTLSYALWHNMSLHLSVLEIYDDRPAQGVTPNDLQVHSSIGITF
jgi:hypothetical protein